MLKVNVRNRAFDTFFKLNKRNKNDLYACKVGKSAITVFRFLLK